MVGVLYVIWLYCVVGRCTVCYGGLMYVMAVYCVVGRCIVFYGVCCVLWSCTVW